MSVADIPSVVSSEHALGGRLIPVDPRQLAGNITYEVLGNEETKSDFTRSSACTSSASNAKTKVETISIDSFMYKNGMNPDYASEVCETAKVII